MADGGAAGVIAQDGLGLGGMVEAKCLDDGADLLVGVEDAFAMGIERGHAGGELTAILQIDEHADHKPGDLLGAVLEGEAGRRRALHVIDGRNAAFVVQFLHG